jgi:hypothetical protein
MALDGVDLGMLVALRRCWLFVSDSFLGRRISVESVPSHFSKGSKEIENEHYGRTSRLLSNEIHQCVAPLGKGNSNTYGSTDQMKVFGQSTKDRTHDETFCLDCPVISR